RVVEDPAIAADIGGGLAGVLDAVDRPGDGVRLPVDREGVERVGKCLPAGQCVPGADPTIAGVAGAVDRAVHSGRLATDVLHDVDLAAGRPADAADVVAQHPERGPQAL